QERDGVPCTVAADNAYDTQGFVTELRQINATPHVAQNIERNGGSAIDGRTTRHAGYALSLRGKEADRGGLRLGQGHRPAATAVATRSSTLWLQARQRGPGHPRALHGGWRIGGAHQRRQDQREAGFSERLHDAGRSASGGDFRE